LLKDEIILAEGGEEEVEGEIAPPKKKVR